MKHTKLITSTIIGASLFSCTNEKKIEKPNVIMFLVDDLGWNDTSVPMTGTKTKYNKRYQTPNLEKLAKKGVTFTNAHAQALSVPSRASFLTGKNTIPCRIIGDYKPTFNKKTQMEFPGGDTLDAKRNLPRFLKANGYKTIHVGKYHLSEYETAYPTPTQAGFDVNIGGSIFGQPGSYWGTNDFKRGKNQVLGFEKYHGKDVHLTDVITDKAIDEIKQSNKDGKPFFLYMAHYAVHTPIQEHKELLDKYDIEEGEKIDEAKYATMIEGVDNSLGKIMQTLKEMKIDNNTLLIFYSDNGGRVLWRGKKSLYDKYQFNYPLRSGKASIYEGGIRVPAVIYNPKATASNTRSGAPIIIEDIFTTITDITQTKIPEDYKYDGKSLKNIIAGTDDGKKLRDRAMYFHLPYRFEGYIFNGEDFADGGVTPSTAMIKNGKKLIYFHREQRFEMYNLDNDISESKNIFDKNNKQCVKYVQEMHDYVIKNNYIRPIFLKIRSAIENPMDLLLLKQLYNK
jgi:arylsulfatase A-like enzyme